MKRATIMTILAMSLALGAGRADVPAGTNQPEQRGSVANRIQPGAEGVTAANDPAEQQPVRLDLPGNAEKPPVLMAPCDWCIKTPAFSTWEQFRLALSALYGYESVLQVVPVGCKIAPSCQKALPLPA